MPESRKPTHYYGDTVRKLFVVAAILMLFTLPFVINYIPISFQMSLIVILGLDIFAGITNPKQKWGAILDTLVASVGLLSFGYFSVTSYNQYGAIYYFWENQVLAIIFLAALYYSIKTLRGFYVSN